MTNSNETDLAALAQEIGEGSAAAIEEVRKHFGDPPPQHSERPEATDSSPEAPLLENPYFDNVLDKIGPRKDPRWRQDRFQINFSPYRPNWSLVYSWAIPTEETVRYMAESAPSGIVEIGAGSGYWAWMLEQAGADVVAYDLNPPDGSDPDDLDDSLRPGGSWHSRQRAWFDVRRGGVEVAREHPGRTLFLCWPLYDNPMAFLALGAYGGTDLFYVGEREGGCTADDAFFDQLELEWKEVATLDVVQWSGINDCFQHYERKADK
jgi:hypothetical protein